MPEIIIPGPEGRLEARYQKGKDSNSPLCLVLHPHPRQGGTMNNKIVYNIYHSFKNLGFATLRFNFSSSDPSLSKDKKLNTDIWYEEGTYLWVKAAFDKRGYWEYRIKKVN